MATITGLTAERMLEIEASSVVDGEVVAGNLILTKHDSSTINAGSVIGPAGPTGAGLNASVIAQTTNLNTIIAPGAYLQMVDAWATLALNYPLASTGGWLRVMANGSNVSQSFEAVYSATDPAIYHRTSANGGTSWGTWRRGIVADSTGAYTFKENATFTKKIKLTNTDGFIGAVELANTGLFRQVDALGAVMIQYGGNTANYMMVSDDGAPFARVPAMYTRTTGNAANVHVASNGSLYRSTSVLDSKLSVEDAPSDWAEKTLSLRPRTWLDRGNLERYVDNLERDLAGEEVNWDDVGLQQIDERIPGFVAEEVIEAGLDIFTTKDADGNLDGLAYDRITAGLVSVVQKQQEQIDELKALVATLMEG